MADMTIKQWAAKRVNGMHTERTSFIDHYMELSQNISPRRGRFFIADRNKGDKRHQAIINSKGTQALRTARAGMFAGVMSPARPWFKLTTPDPDMMDFEPVKEWLFKVEALMRAIFNESNLYNMAPTMIGELLLFGTGCMTHVDNFNDVARFFAHTVGSYMIAQNDDFEVDTMARQFQMTTEQMVRKFKYENVSQAIKTSYDRGSYDQWWPVTHYIYPNDKQDYRNPMSKKFCSIYFEPGNSAPGNVGSNSSGFADDKLLSRSGFNRFPAYCPRWEVAGEDIYGTDCPGMTSLGDVKGLQVMEKRLAQAIDKQVNPPLHGPASLRNQPVSSLPGGLTTYDTNGSENQKLMPIYMVNMNLADAENRVVKQERRIDDAFYVPLFLAITNMEGIQPRNEFELQQRHSEALLQLGPVLERLHGEFLNGLIDNTFDQCAAAGILPPPPPELQGQPLKIEYVSTLAQAQKAVAMNGIDRLAGFVGGLMKAGFTQAGDKFDADQAIEEAATILGTPPRLVVPSDKVAQVRAERQKQEQQMRMMQMAQAGAATAKDAAAAGTADPSLLTRAVGRDTARVDGENTNK